MAAEPVCSWMREEAGRYYRKSADEGGRDIYSLGSKDRMGIWRIICLENRNFFERWQSWLELISEQNKLLQNWGACVDTVFWHVSRKVFWRRRGCQFERNQKMYRVRIGRWDAADGSEEYSVKMMIRAFGWSADGELPMNQEEERKSKFYKDSDDSVVIFK